MPTLYPNEEQELELDLAGDLGYSLIKKYCGEKIDNKNPINNLKLAYEQWLKDNSPEFKGKIYDHYNSSSKEKPFPEMMACALGAYWGNFLCDTFNMRWLFKEDYHDRFIVMNIENGISAYPMEDAARLIEKKYDIDIFEKNYKIIKELTEK